MIELRNVSKSYRSRGGVRVVLDDLSVCFSGDTNIGILGGNGSGKSTLVRMIAGMERPDRGKIIRRARVSYPVGYAGAFHPLLTARENVRFIARVYGADVSAVVRFVREFAELGQQFDERIAVYSNSMKARVTFALSMAIPFDIYLVDETTAVGDAVFKQKCIETFADRRHTAKVVMVSQAVTSIRKICTSGAILMHGRLRLFSTMSAAIEAYRAGLGVHGATAHRHADHAN